MSDAAWIALGGVAMSALIAALGGILRLLSKIGQRFTDLNDRAETRAVEITDRLTTLVDRHEQQDQDRHTENVQRLTRLETLVLNGHRGPRRNATR